MRSYKSSKSDFRPRRRFGPMAALGALVFAACDPSSFLEVSDPGAMSAADAQSAANAPTLMNGVIGDFECALGAFIVSMGALSEELGDRGFPPPRGTGDSVEIPGSSIVVTSWRVMFTVKWIARIGRLFTRRFHELVGAPTTSPRC